VLEPSDKELEATSRADSVVAPFGLESSPVYTGSYKSARFPRGDLSEIEDSQSVASLLTSSASEYRTLSEENAASSSDELGKTSLIDDASISTRVLDSVYQERCNCG